MINIVLITATADVRYVYRYVNFLHVKCRLNLIQITYIPGLVPIQSKYTCSVLLICTVEKYAC